MPYKKYLSVGVCLLLVLLFLCSCSNGNGDSSISISVDILSATYSGAYTGNALRNKPEGPGTFTFSSENDNFILTGTWQQGLLQGSTVITYPDGTQISAEYEDGLINGEVTRRFSDGSYEKFHCNDGRPYGRIIKYDSSDKVAGYDYYYQASPLSELKAKSETADYHTMLNAPSELLIKPLKISCTVVSIFEDSETAYIKLSDSNNNLYIGKYNNTSPDKYAQAIVPNLKVGDEITAYGYLQKSAFIQNSENIGSSILISDFHNINTTTLSNETLEESQNTDSSDDGNFSSLDENGAESETETESESESAASNMDFGNTFPVICLFAADLSSDSQITDTKTIVYSDIIRYPYQYADQKFKLSGTVMKQTIDYNLQTTQIIFAEENTDNYYYATYNFSSDSVLPAIGDYVVITGTYQGNYKNMYYNQASPEYIIYPSLSVTKLKIN